MTRSAWSLLVLLALGMLAALPARGHEPPAPAQQPPAQAQEPPARAQEPPAPAEQPPARGQEAVTFVYAPPETGDVVRGVESMDLQFDIEIAMGELELGSVRTRQRQQEEVTATLVTWTARKREATLVFATMESTETTTNPGGGTETTRESQPHAGKSYRVVQSGDGTPTVTPLPKGPLSSAEVTLVLQAFAELPRAPGPLEEALRSRSLRVGDEITADPKLAQELLEFGAEETFRLSEARVVLREVVEIDGERCGVLQVDVTMVGDEEGMSMSMTATGEASLSLEGMRPHRFTLRGPLTVVGRLEQDGLAMTMRGGGAFEASAEWSYTAAK